MLLTMLKLALLSVVAGGLTPGPTTEPAVELRHTGPEPVSAAPSQDKSSSTAAMERTLDDAIADWECPMFEGEFCEAELMEAMEGRLVHCRALAPFYKLTTSKDCRLFEDLGVSDFATSALLLKAQFDREVRDGQEELASYVFSGRNLLNAFVMVASLTLGRLLWWGSSGVRSRCWERMVDAVDRWDDNGFGR